MNSSMRKTLRPLVGLALGAVLATSGGVGTVLAAKVTPAITGVSCTTKAYETDPTERYTTVSWAGLRPSRVTIDWYGYGLVVATTVERPKGTSLRSDARW